jgi:hypothetical protein
MFQPCFALWSKLPLLEVPCWLVWMLVGHALL